MDKIGKLFESFIDWHGAAGDDGGKLSPESAVPLAAAVVGKTFVEICEALEKHGGFEKVIGKLLSSSKGGKQQIGFLAGDDDDEEHEDDEGMHMKFPGAPPAIEHRRGVPGTGPYGNPRKRRSPRYEITDAYDRYEHDGETGEDIRDAVRHEMRMESERRAEIDSAVRNAVGRHTTHGYESYAAAPHNAIHDDSTQAKRGVPGTGRIHGSAEIHDAVGPGSTRR